MAKQHSARHARLACLSGEPLSHKSGLTTAVRGTCEYAAHMISTFKYPEQAVGTSPKRTVSLTAHLSSRPCVAERPSAAVSACKPDTPSTERQAKTRQYKLVKGHTSHAPRSAQPLLAEPCRCRLLLQTGHIMSNRCCMLAVHGMP